VQVQKLGFGYYMQVILVVDNCLFLKLQINSPLFLPILLPFLLICCNAMPPCIQKNSHIKCKIIQIDWNDDKIGDIHPLRTYIIGVYLVS